jgi:WW domain
MSTASRLPRGWEIKIDITTGEAFYFDSIAQKTHRTLPKSSDGLHVGSKSVNALPAGWEVKVDIKSGKPYFVDHNSRQSHWKLPDDVSVSSTSGLSVSTNHTSAPASPQQDERQHRFDNANQSRDLPPVPVVERTPLVTRAASSQGPSEASIDRSSFASRSRSMGPPGNWERRIDADTGDPYYVNHASKATQWDLPDGYAELEFKGRIRLVLRWERRFDSDGDPYYMDHLNHTSQWEMPPDFFEPEPANVAVRAPASSGAVPAAAQTGPNGKAARRRGRNRADRPRKESVSGNPATRFIFRGVARAIVGRVGLALFDLARTRRRLKRPALTYPGYDVFNIGSQPLEIVTEVSERNIFSGEREECEVEECDECEVEECDECEVEECDECEVEEYE